LIGGPPGRYLPGGFIYFYNRGLVAAGGAANHPRGAGATRLGAEVDSAAMAGESRGSPRRDFSCGHEGLVAAGRGRVGFVAAGAAAMHPGGAGAGRFLLWARGFVAADAAAHHPRLTGTTCPAANYLRIAWLIQ
jgi:hypothetical protein